jgi:membrane-associated HD superfamily phosphohydrolase
MINDISTILFTLKDIQYYAEPGSFLMAILLIFFTNFKKPNAERPLLNKLLLIGLSGWFLYSIMDIFLFELAWVAIPQDAPLGIYTGYPIEYPKLMYANIMRDFAIFGAMMMNWTFMIAAFCIKFGEAKTEKIFTKNKWMLVIIVISIVVVVIGDQVAVTIWENGGYSASAFTVGLGAIFIYIAIGFYILAAVFLIWNLYSASKSQSDPQMRKALIILGLGILFMGIGHSFWVIYSKIGALYPDWASQTVNWLSMSLLGHFLWMLSPIFIIVGILYGRKANLQNSAI